MNPSNRSAAQSVGSIWGTKEKLLYWIPTILVAFVMLSGGIIDGLRTEEALKIFRHLGYPDYFSALLGIAKVLGVIALLAPVPRTLREWAYAGFAFDVISAAVSILAVRDPAWNITVPVIALGLILLSHRMWHRKLAVAAEEGTVSVRRTALA